MTTTASITRSASVGTRQLPRNIRFVLVVGVIVAASLIAGWLYESQVARAHAPSTYFPATWSDSPNMRRGYVSGLGISLATFDTAAIRAGNAWDNVPNNNGADSPSIGWAGTSSSSVFTCTSANSGEIFIGSSAGLSTGTLAVESTCTSGTSITRSSIRISSNVSWANGASSGAYDIQYTLTHEAGHAMGWVSHITNACGSPKSTMCGTQGTNTTVGRTLELHDKHTFDDAYK